jgi:[protein-PII] uridylyltransferase
MFLHVPDASAVDEMADAILYPLWDSGLQVSHAVRTPAECSAESTSRLESLTALLDARHLAGSQELVDHVREGAADVIRREPAAFVDDLRRSREDRDRRYGSVGRMLEPDLKEGLGGLRDIQILRWLAAAEVGGGAEEEPGQDPTRSLTRSLDYLLLVRSALHLASSSVSNRLAAELQETVAARLGIEGRPGWEARDEMMRSVLDHGRWVEHLADGALTDPGAAHTPRSISGRDLLEVIVLPDGSAILQIEDALGTLPRLLPEWEDVRGRPQRDPYHRYPVDVHLLETMAECARLLRESDEAFAVEAATSIGDPVPLLLGALFHDIGKVGKGSHVATGIEVAARALARMGVDDDRRDDVLFLVAEHLLLSDTATRRNLEDEDLIVHVAAKVGDERRLALLYLLTVADAHATGPTASSPWRLGLVRELVAKVSHAFQRGLMDRDRAGRLTEAEGGLREALFSAEVPEGDAEAFIAAMPSGYALWAQPGDAAGDIALVAPRPEPAEIRTSVRPGDRSGMYRVAIGAVDRLGLLALTAGSMTLSGLSILGAQAFTTEDGLALDVFEVRGAFEEEVDRERWDRFRSLMAEALQGKLDLRERVHSLRAHYRPAPSGIPARVRIDQQASDFFTVVEVSAPDRLGLLFDLASAISQQELDVHVAKVATYVDRVVDVFYVRDAGGQKLEDSARVAELERSLTTAATER